MTFREITTRDIPALFDVRTSVRENTYTREGLYRDGITEETVTEMICSTHRGWLCEADSKIVGFAMANGTTGEFWVIAVLPEYEGQGIGSKLLLWLRIGSGRWVGKRYGCGPPWILASKLTPFIATVGGQTRRFEPTRES